MSSTIGNNIKISIFGESHGKAIGVVMDNLPAGEEINTDELMSFLARRRPGGDNHSTTRKEADVPTFLSGIKDGRTTGFPLCAVIENTDQHSGDYSAIPDTPRPAHADYSAYIKYSGFADMRGGGHFSGRLTAPLCIAGGIAKQLLSRRGIDIGAHIFSIGDVNDTPFDPVSVSKDDFVKASEINPPVLDKAVSDKMLELIGTAKKELNSVGGVIECAVTGLGAGIGSPMFGGLEGRLAAMLFGIPAVKGVEFGSGFGGTLLKGSENNDEFYIKGNKILTRTNNHGGILGGISTGMPLIMRIAMKPTPSIAMSQKTVNLREMTDTEIEIKGRHDPCVAIRAVPVMEAAVAVVILDLIMEENVPPAASFLKKA